MYWLRWHYHVNDIAGAPCKIKKKRKATKRQNHRQSVVAGRKQLYCAVQSWSPSHCQTTTGKVCGCGYELCVFLLLVIVDWQAHRNAVFDIDWMPGENQLVTASGDQNIALWDVTAESSVAAFHGHTSSIKTVRFLLSHNGALLWYWYMCLKLWHVELLCLSVSVCHSYSLHRGLKYHLAAPPRYALLQNNSTILFSRINLSLVGLALDLVD